jgi:hypothetical protein
MECGIGYVHDFCGLNVEEDMFQRCFDIIKLAMSVASE